MRKVMTIVRKVMGLIGLIGLIGPMGPMGPIGLIGLMGLMGCSSDDGERETTHEVSLMVGASATGYESEALSRDMTRGWTWTPPTNYYEYK